MDYSNEELRAYYDALPDTYGRDALCKMELPKELPSKTALDVGCRRGKGVYKIAEQVRSKGCAIGVEWRADMLERAKAGEEHAIAKCGYDKSNMLFYNVYPERLEDELDASIADFAYVNCVINLFYDPVRALAQIHRVLKPGGLLVCDTVLATGPRDATVVKEARKLGNAVQAAPHRKDLMSWLMVAGFDVTSIGAFSTDKVDPSLDADGNPTVPLAPSDEPVSFVATSIHIYKADDIDRHVNKLRDDISQFR